MTLKGNWSNHDKIARYQALGQLGGYQVKAGAPLAPYKRGMPKLTQREQAELLTEYAKGKPTKDIAAAYGVDKSYVSKLAKRRGLMMRDSEEVRRRKALSAEGRGK
jgi:hypothetical protein